MPIWKQGPSCHPRDPHHLPQDDCNKGGFCFMSVCNPETLKEEKSVMLDEHFAELEGAREESGAPDLRYT